MKRTLINVIGGLVVLAGAIAGFAGLFAMRPEAQEREAVEQVYNVQVFDAGAFHLEEIVTGFGTARADREVIVAAQVAGEITGLHPNLRVGQKLSGATDEVLAQIDPRSYQQRVDRAVNQLSEAETEISRLQREKENNARLLAQARRDLVTIREQYDRVRKNKTLGAASATEVTRALLEVRQYEQTILTLENQGNLLPVQLEAARKRKASNETDIKLARLDLENARIEAPFAGVVSEVMVEKGQYVRSGDSLIRLTSNDLVEVPLPLPLADFLKVEKLLQSGVRPQVELAVNETASAQWTGQVVRVAPEVDSATRTAMVFVLVDNKSGLAASPQGTRRVPLRPGTFVQARISGPKHHSTVVIPRDAAFGGKVFVAKDDRVEERVVRFGETLQSLVIVEDGVAAGEQVVITNLDVLRPNVRISVRKHVTLSDELSKQRSLAVRLLPDSESE